MSRASDTIPCSKNESSAQRPFRPCLPFCWIEVYSLPAASSGGKKQTKVGLHNSRFMLFPLCSTTVLLPSKLFLTGFKLQVQYMIISCFLRQCSKWQEELSKDWKNRRTGTFLPSDFLQSVDHSCRRLELPYSYGLFFTFLRIMFLHVLVSFDTLLGAIPRKTLRSDAFATVITSAMRRCSCTLFRFFP